MIGPLGREIRLSLLEQALGGVAGEAPAGAPAELPELDVARRVSFALLSGTRTDASPEQVVAAQGIAAALLRAGIMEMSEDLRELFRAVLEREVVEESAEEL